MKLIHSSLAWLAIMGMIGIVGCASQDSIAPTKNPSANSTGILLKVDKNPDETFSDLISYFKQRDYQLNEINRYQRYLRTNFLTLSEEMYTYQIEAVIPPSDSTVVVFRAQAIGPQTQSPATITKEMGRLSSSLWEQFHEAVIDFPHRAVYYTSD